MSGLCLDAVLEIIQAGQVAVFEADYYVCGKSLMKFCSFIYTHSLHVLPCFCTHGCLNETVTSNHSVRCQSALD